MIRGLGGRYFLCFLTNKAGRASCSCRISGRVFFIYFYLSLPFLSFYMRVSVLLFSLYCTWFDIQCNAGVGVFDNRFKVAGAVYVEYLAC